MPKKKAKWSFIVESDAVNMEKLEDDLLVEGGTRWEIPQDSVIGILRLEEARDEK